MNCQKNFPIEESDLDFYKKVDMPEPTQCPLCREQRRLAQINQVNLFQRKCDATGELIITNYPSESPYKVYAQKYWWSDAFDGTAYGRDFDFNRPFFEQWAELSKAVPRPALMTDFSSDENSAYTNYSGKNKNCYLIFDSDENWDCLYSYGMSASKNSMDSYRVQNLELCYESVDSKNCYNCAYTINSSNCVDSLFINNCTSVRNCIFCSNLTQKEYHIYNKPVSKQEFDAFKASLQSYEVFKSKVEEFERFKLGFPHKYMRGFQNENVSGNHLVGCKDCSYCFDSMNVWGGKYCTQMFMQSKDCMDTDEVGSCELVYESNNVGYNSFFLRFCNNSLNQNSNMTYCSYCFLGCQHLFGCIGLKRKKYCILNKQYSQEEYERLMPKIIAHMQKMGEWGEYFPISSSTLPYNLTMAQEHYPLNREEAWAKGYSWREEDKKEYKKQMYALPDDIKKVPDSITQEVLACESCRKNYRITPKELELHRTFRLPLPHTCFFCRHKKRAEQRTPRQLFQRPCDQCGTSLLTAYEPGRLPKVYCEKCYLAEIY